MRNLELFTITLYSQYQPLLLSAEGGGGGGGRERRQPAVPNFEKGGRQKKMSAWGVESLPQLFACGAYYVSCQKRLYKMKYGFKGSIFKCQSWPALAKKPIFSFGHFGSVKPHE